MAAGDKMMNLLRDLSPVASELVQWHLDKGTPASWLSETLEGFGHEIKTTSVKDYRRRINRQKESGTGPGHDLLEETLRAKQEEILDQDALGAAPRILILDIERLPGTFTSNFWDMRSHLNKRISPDDVTEWPRTICWAAQWEGEDPDVFYFAAEWDGGHEAMIRAAWDLFDEADVVVGHNMARFDAKKLRSEWALYGLHDPSPWKVVDTMRVAFDRFGFESNTLNSLCTRFEVDAKTDKYDAKTARAATEGDREAQSKLKRYNVGDIVATKGLYRVFRDRGYIPGHPVMAPGVPMRCTSCGGGNLEPMDKPYRANVMEYRAYRCTSCGSVLKHYRGTRMTTLSAVKS